jgi:hypothetical protein
MEKPERLKAALDEFERRLGETPYISPLPEGVKPF